MRFLDRATLRSLFVSRGRSTRRGSGIANSAWFTLPFPALNFLYYCALAGATLLAWRFHSSRTFLSLLVIFLSEQAASFVAGQSYVLTTVGAIAMLVPINFILIALMHERGFAVESIAPIVLLLFVESLTVAVFWGSSNGRPSPLLHARHLGDPLSLPQSAVLRSPQQWSFCWSGSC